MQQNHSNLQSAIQVFDLKDTSSNQAFNRKDCINNELDSIISSELLGFQSLKTEKQHTPDFYSNAIERLSEASDAEMGVKWHVDAEYNTLIRDARTATGPVQNSIYAQLATAFNSARAADRMIRMKDGEIRTDEELDKNEQIKNIRDKLIEITKEVKEGKVEKIDLKALNGFLVNTLRADNRFKEIKDKDLLKQLNTTKDLAGLEDKKYNVATIYMQGDKVVYEADAMIPPLPDEKVKDEEFKKQVTDAQKDDFSKNMVSAYWDALKAQETIPTQNLKTLPGLRNAYVKENGVIEDGQLKSFGQFIHTGTVSSGLKIDGEKNMIANMNVEHMAAMTKEATQNDKIIITSLNTPLLRKDETRAVSQLKKAVKGKEHVSWALTPMNGMRRLVISKTKAYDEALKELGTQLEKNNLDDANNPVDENKKVIAQYLQGKTSEKRARQALAKMENGIEKNTLLEAIRTKSAVNESFLGSIWRKMTGGYDVDDKGMSRSLRQTAGMIALSVLVNAGVLGENIKIPIISTHCKSGKDRTGAISIEVQRRILQANGISNGLEAQVKAGHVQKMAEIGGTPGNIGMKGHSGLSGKLYKNFLNLIGLKTAKNNKINKLSNDNIQETHKIEKPIEKVEHHSVELAPLLAKTLIKEELSNTFKSNNQQAEVFISQNFTKKDLEKSSKLSVKEKPQEANQQQQRQW